METIGEEISGWCFVQAGHAFLSGLRETAKGCDVEKAGRSEWILILKQEVYAIECPQSGVCKTGPPRNGAYLRRVVCSPGYNSLTFHAKGAREICG